MLNQYQFILTATEGVLFGDVTHYESSWYDSRKDAETILEGSRTSFRTMGRKTDSGRILIRTKPVVKRATPVAVFA